MDAEPIGFGNKDRAADGKPAARSAGASSRREVYSIRLQIIAHPIRIEDAVQVQRGSILLY